MITTQRLRQLFDYRTDGNLVRKIKTAHRTKAGDVVGSYNPNGYRYAMVNGKNYPLHRLIWVWHGNEIPQFLDHIDRNTNNNRIENLRVATREQNMWNKKVGVNNTTGIKGVCWNKQKQKYRVRIGVNSKRIHLGDFADLELAEFVASEARDLYHGIYASY